MKFIDQLFIPSTFIRSAQFIYTGYEVVVGRDGYAFISRIGRTLFGRRYRWVDPSGRSFESHLEVTPSTN